MPTPIHKRFASLFLIMSIFIVLLMSLSLYLEQRNTTKEQEEKNKLSEELVVDIVSQAPKRGANTPTIRVVEFSDFTCIHCKEFNRVINSVLERYPDVIQHIWFNAFDFDNEPAKNAAIAANCAHEQGLFWPFHDELFETDSLSVAKLNQIADMVNLDKQQFQGCIESTITLEKLKREQNFVALNAIEETPTIFIGDEKIEGNLTENRLIELIERLLP